MINLFFLFRLYFKLSFISLVFAIWLIKRINKLMRSAEVESRNKSKRRLSKSLNSGITGIEDKTHMSSVRTSYSIDSCNHLLEKNYSLSNKLLGQNQAAVPHEYV
jgi:hypothetical protein